MRFPFLFYTLAASLLVWVLPAHAQLRPMVYSEATVNADIDTVWDDWTTSEGLESHFAPKAIVELKTGGSYEVWFMPNAPKGARGAEDGIILGLQNTDGSTARMIQFTWKMPPYMPKINENMTVVQMWFIPQMDGETRVRLFHTGFGDTKAWDEARDYFNQTWPKVLRDYREFIREE